MKKILTALAVAIAIPAVAYAQGPAPAPNPAPPAGMKDQSECMKMHAMMMSKMQGTAAHGGHSTMNGGNSQAHHQMMKPDANAPATSTSQQQRK